jgi:sugar lactone lactonase YvrE
MISAIRLAALFSLMLIFAHVSGATIETIAGTGEKGFSPDGTAAREARLNNVYGLIRLANGNLVFCDVDNHAVREIRDGRVYTVAGSGKRGNSGDGKPAREAELNEPYEVRARGKELFWVERLNHLVRKLNEDGTVSTVAGEGHAGFGGDGGPLRQAQFREPHSIQFDGEGNLLVCDIGNHRVRKLDFSIGKVETFAGTGEKLRPRDGAKYRTSPLFGPRAVDLDGAGHLWLALREGNAIYRLDPDGTIHHAAGTGERGLVDGPALESSLSGPKGISAGPDGNIYFADTESHTIRKINLARNRVERVAGTGEPGDGPDGPALECNLRRPHGIFVEADGTILVGDSENHRIRRIRP